MFKTLLAVGAVAALMAGGMKMLYSAPAYYSSGTISVAIFEARKKNRRAKIIKRYRK